MPLTIPVRTPPAYTEHGIQLGTERILTIDDRALARALRAHVRGEVRFSDGDRALYSTDASNYRMLPIGVVLPRDVDDVIATVSICREHGAPIFARGGGTGIPGQSTNDGVLLDFSKYMHRVQEIDPVRRLARVQPGCVLDTLNKHAKRHGLLFGPDPATHSRCTLGGMIGNNSCGIHSVLAGRTSDNIEELDVITYDGLRLRVGKTSDEEYGHIVAAGGRRGEIYSRLRALRDKYADQIRQRFPRIPRRISGYNLNELLPENGFNVARALVGSECTCVLVLEATVNLVENPEVRSLLVLGYPDIYTAGDHVTEPLPFGPIGLEALDDTFIQDMKKKGMHPEHLDMMPPGKAWLLVEFGGKSKEEADARARRLMDDLKRKGNPPPMKLFDDPKQEALVWHLREEGLGATARVPGEPDNWEGWEDAAVPPEKVGAYLRDFRRLLDKYQYDGALYGHFGQGCVHTRLDFDLVTAAGIQKWKSFLEDAADLVIRYGGSFSGEHGDGQARGWLLPKMFGHELMDAFREFKSIWDPEWKMNPGKLIDPYPVDANLRLGTHYHPKDPPTHFAFPDDKHSFAYAMERCVGAGVCRRHEGGTMCPSYMVTLEEKHSTRGRARLLFEMLQGEAVHDGWKSEEVKDALDLCLSCKGCKGDCPVQVDMATYKAEFLSHYYEGRLRPRSAYAMGLIHWWARLASLAPRLANLLSQTPGLSTIAKWLGGIAQKRQMPRFATETFKEWFRKRGPRNEGKPQVILWADTFNNHFHPQVAQAGVDVLEAAGFQVLVPVRSLCCGRPLYDYGMLTTAKAMLREILDTLQPWIEAGTPMVVLEPSCCAVFRDELHSFFPEDADAQRLRSQTFLLSEFLEKKAPHFQPPKWQARAFVHGHCHHKSLMKMDDEEAVLKKIGLDFQELDSGCCGMAGSFGFEADHYDISLKVGERVLLPAVRSADRETMIITDGFSCRQQIEQTTGRRALHLAQVLQLTLHQSNSRARELPEDEAERLAEQPQSGFALPAGVAFVAGIATGAALLWLWRKRSGTVESRAIH
jgi:FAD/FMN-containing dehydrogenase/Fe-S oxidoreductase